MIFSKNSFYIHELTVKDKALPVLNSVLFCKDGTTVALSKNIIMIVEPVPVEIRERLHLKNTFNKKDFFISADNVKKILQSIPIDSIFKGLLEFADIFYNEETEKAEINIHDGTQKISRIVNCMDYDPKFIKEILVDFHKDMKISTGECRMIVGLQRYVDLLNIVRKIINDKNDETPLCLFSFSSGGRKRYLKVKSIIPKTGQQVIGIAWMSDKNVDEYWIKDGLIERRFGYEG